MKLPPTQRQTLGHYCFHRSYLTKPPLKPTKSAGLSGHSPQRVRRSAKRVRRGTICKEAGFSQCLNPTAWAKALRISMYNSRYKSIRIPVLFETAHATAEREVLIDSGATCYVSASKTLTHEPMTQIWVIVLGRAHVTISRTPW